MGRITHTLKNQSRPKERNMNSGVGKVAVFQQPIKRRNYTANLQPWRVGGDIRNTKKKNCMNAMENVIKSCLQS
jgi:hypothetical protein